MAGYDTTFYDTIRPGIRESAAALVPILIEHLGLKPGSVVLDVGCGEGWWAQTFTDHGMVGWGTDGAWHGTHLLGDRFFATDLASQPVHFATPTRRADLVISLEVAEHLPPARAASFVAELCQLAPLVVFSAAIPGQGGTGHVNEQWPDYWADLFSANNYAVDGNLRLDIWADDRIENWYRQNLLIAYAPFPGADGPPFDAPDPLRLVHPVLYDARRR